MQLLFLLFALVTASIAIKSLSLAKSKIVPKHNHWEFFALSGFYFSWTLLNILWALNSINYSSISLGIILIASFIIQSLALHNTIKRQSESKNLSNIFFIYLLIMILSALFPLNLRVILFSISILCLALFSLKLKYSQSEKNNSILLWMIYVLFSSLTFLSQYYLTSSFTLLSLISSVFYLAALTKSSNSALKSQKPSSLQYQKESSSFVMFRWLVFTLVLTSLTFIGTINIHEVGHLISSKFQSCEVKIILYEEGNYPHTQTLCPNEAETKISIAFGIILPSLIALILLFAGGSFLKEIALLTLGFDLLASYKDFLDMGFDASISSFILVLGVLLIVGGIFWLMGTKVTHEELLEQEKFRKNK